MNPVATCQNKKRARAHRQPKRVFPGKQAKDSRKGTPADSHINAKFIILQYGIDRFKYKHGCQAVCTQADSQRTVGTQIMEKHNGIRTTAPLCASRRRSAPVILTTNVLQKSSFSMQNPSFSIQNSSFCNAKSIVSNTPRLYLLQRRQAAKVIIFNHL